MAQLLLKCDFCTREFRAGKKRKGTTLCRNCRELRHLIQTWVRDGVWAKEAKENQGSVT
jgi:hypothetical protein